MKRTLLDIDGLSTDDDTNIDSHDDGGSLSTNDETTDDEHNSFSTDDYTDDDSMSSNDAELKTRRIKNKIKKKNSRTCDRFDPNVIGRSYIDGTDDECDDYNDYSSMRCRPPSLVVMESVPVAGMHCLIPSCRFDEDDPVRGINKNVKNSGKQEGLLSKALRLIRIEDTMECGSKYKKKPSSSTSKSKAGKSGVLNRALKLIAMSQNQSRKQNSCNNTSSKDEDRRAPSSFSSSKFAELSSPYKPASNCYSTSSSSKDEDRRAPSSFSSSKFAELSSPHKPASNCYSTSISTVPSSSFIQGSFSSLDEKGYRHGDLLRAIKKGASEEEVSALVSRGGPRVVHEVNVIGNTPLHVACRDGADPKLVRLLVETGGPDSVKATNKFGQTPLGFALENDNIDLIALVDLEKDLETIKSEK